MKITNKYMTPFFALLFATLFGLFAQVAQALPTVEKRDVFVPPVLYPHAGTVWYTGQKHNVTWDVSHAPVNITNYLGEILLRADGVFLPLFLARGFNIRVGHIEVTVPWVVTGNQYQILLIGDGGNFGPNFTIIGDSMTMTP